MITWSKRHDQEPWGGTWTSNRVEGKDWKPLKKEHYMPPDCLQYFGAGPYTRFYASSRAGNVGIMVRVPDASGLLTGKVNTDTKFDKNDHRSFRKQEFIIEAMQKIENMRPLASKGWNITELAIKFILSQKQISVICRQ